MDIRKIEIDALCFRREDMPIVAILDNTSEDETSEDRVTVVYEEDGRHETITVGINGNLGGDSREWDMDVILKAAKEKVAKEDTEEEDEDDDEAECLRCHFCGACECEVDWLIVDESCGPNICDDCVTHCAKLINKKNASSNKIPFTFVE